jgi:cation diffusion facilitator CzcD-associated flavoprotein CzcO
MQTVEHPDVSIAPVRELANGDSTRPQTLNPVASIEIASIAATSIDVAIIGTGPYGLSIAAQLREYGVPFRIFGFAMETWRAHMPAGMRLKSDGFASNLYVRSGYTLKTYCAEHGLPYDDLQIPVPLDTFVGYGLAFQRRFVPMVEEKRVVSLMRANDAFEVTLEGGERVRANRVVVACGINEYAHMPAELANLDAASCSHASAHRDLSVFAGKRVAVIGGGASALDVAAILNRYGAAVSLVSRHPLEFHAPPPTAPRGLLERVRRPHLGLGVSLRSAIYTVFPSLFRYLPRRFRHHVVRTHLGPAGGWFVRDEVIGNVPVHCGYSLKSARSGDDGVVLGFEDEQGAVLQLSVDHVIAATGYKVDLKRLDFLDRSLCDAIANEDGPPILSGNFESSIPGLYFVGGAAAATFGPLLRFALGARFTSHRLTAHLVRVSRSTPRTAR